MLELNYILLNKLYFHTLIIIVNSIITNYLNTIVINSDYDCRIDRGLEVRCPFNLLLQLLVSGMC